MWPVCHTRIEWLNSLGRNVNSVRILFVCGNALTMHKFTFGTVTKTQIISLSLSYAHSLQRAVIVSFNSRENVSFFVLAKLVQKGSKYLIKEGGKAWCRFTSFLQIHHQVPSSHLAMVLNGQLASKIFQISSFRDRTNSLYTLHNQVEQSVACNFDAKVHLQCASFTPRFQEQVCNVSRSAGVHTATDCHHTHTCMRTWTQTRTLFNQAPNTKVPWTLKQNKGGRGRRTVLELQPWTAQWTRLSISLFTSLEPNWGANNKPEELTALDKCCINTVEPWTAYSTSLPPGRQVNTRYGNSTKGTYILCEKISIFFGRK